MAGPGDEMAAGAVGRGSMRASHADREQVIEALKDAFVHGRLTKDELDARAGRALAARTYAELAALTADIPPAPAASWPSRALGPDRRRSVDPARRRPPVPARRRPLARAAVGSGGCLALAAAALWATFIIDPGPSGADRPWAGVVLQLAIYAVMAGVWILCSGVAASMQQRRSSWQLPPRPGPGGHALVGGRRGGTGRGVPRPAAATPPDPPVPRSLRRCPGRSG